MDVRNQQVFGTRGVKKPRPSVCQLLGGTEEEAELISLKVMQNVIDELKDQNEVNSSTIYEIAHRELETFHPEAAYMYANHYDVN
jgi:hypothetical protein